MILRLAILLTLGCITAAGPVSWDDSKCAQKCNGGSKYQYSSQTSYIYKYEISNELKYETAKDLSMQMKATVTLTAISKCEMVLEVSDVQLQHGPLEDATSSLLLEIQRHPLPFSWDDGKIEHVCPNPEDSNEVNNIKKAILSAFQNTMRTFEYNAYNVETDILGSCHTDYKIQEKGIEQYEIIKTKNIPTCTNHLKGQTLMIAEFYNYPAYRQHLPIMSNEKASCKQVVSNGILEEVKCAETASLKVPSDYGYVIEVSGNSKLKKIATEPASGVMYRAPKKESLVYKYQPHEHSQNDNAESEARLILQHICENSKDLITKKAATYVHKLVYTIRKMNAQSVERIYRALKTNEICSTGKKTLSIYLDALRFASSGSSVALLSKLATNGEMSKIDSILWMTLMPFSSYVEEETISSALPLLRKDVANRQSLLGTTALAYKYCTINPECESSQALKDISSNLKEFLGNKCHTENKKEEMEVLTALKAFGNLGYVGESATDIFDCALSSTNSAEIRIAAVDAFRRSPCTEQIVTKLLDIYTNKNEHDELRIASLISLSRCATTGIIKRVVDTYSEETSKQVEVFTWSFLKNMQSSSDPLRAKVKQYLFGQDLHKPTSTDITKFSRNFEISFLSDIFNVGESVEANVIHSSDSFLPKSGNVGLKLNLFGNQLNVLEAGARVEDLEHILEKLFGPVGIFSNVELEDLINLIPETLKREKRSADSYDSKIDALTERLGYKRDKVPHGTAFIRVLGHELGLIHLNDESLKHVVGLKVNDMLQNIANLGKIDDTRILFIDAAVLFPSVTGRAYKLHFNGSLALGLSANGKIDLHQLKFPNPQVDIDGKFQPSILLDTSGAFTIESENFKPGVKVETVLNAGVDYQVKAEIRDGRLFHLKLNRERKRSEILSFKRTLYIMNHRGETEMPKPNSYDFNYCTKYLQKVTGAKYCASLTIPHIYDGGKPKIPFIRPMEGSIVVEQVDPSMDGYEVLLEIPDFKNKEEQILRILVDTPNSRINRKLSLDIDIKHPADTCSLSLNLDTPFYTLAIKGNLLNGEDQLSLNVDVTGDGKRRYNLNIDASKVVKGARLIEYQPRITLSTPFTRPVELTGTLVFSKGRKAQLSVNLESRSFDSPFKIKGNLVREGEAIDLQSNWKMYYEFSINALSQIRRVKGSTGYEVGKGLSVEIGHHYEPDGRSYESITFNAKVDNIKIFDRLSFNIDSEVLFAEHQDLNTMLKWDFSFKPLHHLKSDLIFRYGENFEDDTHLVRITFASVLHGDLNNFQKLNFENKLGLTISCLDFDKSATFIAIWDFIDNPKLVLEAGVKRQKDKEIKFEFNYRHLEAKPLKLATDMTFTYDTYKFKYRDETNEIAPHEYDWKATIEPVAGKQLTTDFIYRIKDQEDLHHELEGTVKFPGIQHETRHKGSFQSSDGKMKLSSHSDFGRGAIYSIDAIIERGGMNEIKLSSPFIDGNLAIDTRTPSQTIRADFKSKAGDARRVILTGSVMTSDAINTLNLEVQWDADKDSKKKIAINMRSNKEREDGIEKHIITGSVAYAGAINVDITGKISTDILRGPHFFKADFSGNMEPMTVEINHEIRDGHMNSVTRYLRSGVEKLRLDAKSKLIQRGFSHFEIEWGIFLSSPYKTFDGKASFFRLMIDTDDSARTFISEYRVKISPALGYEGKLNYQRKFGWPGNIRSNLLVTVHNRPLYEGNTSVDYGNGKYSWKTSFTPISKRKIQFISSFEHAARFAAFHHSLATSLQYLQTIELNAVADLRNMEDAKVHSNMDVNTHKLYDVNTTLKMRSMFDFDGEMLIFSKITPSLKIFSKGQTSGQLTKYEMNFYIDSKSVLTGSGELKKRKRGFNGEIVFKYKEKEILVLTIHQDAKVKHERNYSIKLRFPSRLYTANIKVNRENKGIVIYETKFCRNEELCINIDATHKEYDTGYEWQISYKRDDVSFSIERIRESSNDMERFHTVIYNGDHRYGYDVRVGNEGAGKFLSLGIILPSRKIITKTTVEFSLSKPRIKLEISLDGRNHPDRKLTLDARFENHLRDNNPSKLNLIITHPIFEKPIEIQLSGDYKPSSAKYFTSEMSLDYSVDPNDKLIGKLSLEDAPKGTALAVLNIYHKDDKHLDFVIKSMYVANSEEESFGIWYNWKDENNADQEAYLTIKYLEIERKFSFEYQRPRISYRLEGKVKPQESLLSDTIEMDLESVYNGESSKAKLVSDYNTGCFKLHVFAEEGEVIRTIELCTSFQNQKFSFLIESIDDEGNWGFDYLTEVVQKSWNVIGIRTHANPEFIGKFLFQVTALVDELERAGVGNLPFSDSPRFKAIRRSFTSKILKPAKEFVVPEAQKFVKDIRNDMQFLRETIAHYIQKLPSFRVVKDKVQEARAFIRSILYEIWITIYSYYEEHIRTILQFVDKVKETAQNNCQRSEECKSLIRSFERGGWRGLLDEIKNLLLSLPEKIQHLIENPSQDMQNYFRRVMIVLKAFLEPLTKYKCGEILFKVAQLSYDALEPRVRDFLTRLPNYYQSTKERLLSSEYFKLAVDFMKQGISRIQEEVKKINYGKLIGLARRCLEDFLYSIKPLTAKQVVVVHELSGERGIIDVDVHVNVLKNVIQKGFKTVSGTLFKKSVEISRHLSWNRLIIKFKRGLDLNFFPPYKAQAMIVGHEHFVTFDKVFYDFAGECTYLLTRDFEDGNFTVALKPKEGDEAASILIMKSGTTVDINSGRTTVKLGDNRIDLPYQSKHLLVIREGNTIIVDTKNGLQVKCNLIREICSFILSGWYYGKTAGLLGTYNYEEYDEFKRPKGQIANSASVLAKSWELKRGCKTSNLVPDVQINKYSENYELCKSLFESNTSPLSACFSEVDPKDYLVLCARQLSREGERNSLLCNVAAAYVMECEENYVELNLPPKCLICDAPDGSKLEHGDRKKFERLSQKYADTVFIIEDHECNKVVLNDLGNLARAIEKELQNEGFKQSMFAAVGYGGDVGDPLIFTSADQVFFNSRDINNIIGRFKAESKKDSSEVFEAMQYAVTHFSRSDAVKSFVLLSCSPCKYDYTSLYYPVIQQILLERGISLHVINNAEISIRKSATKEKNIIGVDPDTVFHFKDVTQRDLVGEPDLRSQVMIPKDLCISLSQDVNGSFFSTYPLSKSSANEIKNWRSVFARKFLKSAQHFACQWCDCTSTRDHVPSTVCQPCEVKRPRLPFSVGSSNIHSRTVETFLSYILHILGE